MLDVYVSFGVFYAEKTPHRGIEGELLEKEIYDLGGIHCASLIAVTTGLSDISNGYGGLFRSPCIFPAG